jgi:DNA-directed RNA polymerase
MNTLMTQVKVEEVMYTGGINRAERMMAKAEDAGRAHQNPYAKDLFDEFVLPLASAVKEDTDSKRAGRRQAHTMLLTGLDSDAVAYLAVRYVVSNLLSSNPEHHRKLAYGIGRTIHRELVLAQIEQEAPDLYHTLSNDFARRLSKDERHRLTVFMMQAEKNGLNITQWDIGSREQVGFYLLGLLEVSELVVLGAEMRTGYRREAREVLIHPEIIERIDKIKAYVSVSMPVYGPCVEPPLDWAHGVTGGYHTPNMRSANQTLIHGSRSSRRLGKENDMPVVYGAVNALQRTAWAVNQRMLDTVYAVAKEFSTKEIVSLNDTPSPPRPSWLADEWATRLPKDQWPVDKLTEFKQWKRDMAEWHTERKLLGSRYSRFYAATRAAEMFKDQPAIYFVYFADSRGRLYPLTYGLNPQGSDLSKSLIHFAKGKPLSSPDAIKWFHVQGANKWGFDKATLEDRVAWVKERADLIVSFADDPVNNTGWTEAGDPLQFLAWAFEYADYLRNPNFVSRIPISMDGSCNGLQNLSAMFRDEIGGAATNLTANTVMRDIYGDVAKAATKRLAAAVPADEAEKALIDKWLAFGIARSAVKRSVMTTPYGVTERTATEYIVDDYLRHNLGPTFDKTEYRRAAIILMKAVWPAIGDVVVKGREAMDWLKKSARQIVKANEREDKMIVWPTPSGFPASQAYYEVEVHRIRTHLHGPMKIRVHSESDEADPKRHASGLAPNFVHSMDAAHLHLSTNDSALSGIDSLAMIHDDYGTHAEDAQRLYDIIRKQFVAMYLACDPPAELLKLYPYLTAPPTKGNLDIMEVLESDFFFS